MNIDIIGDFADPLSFIASQRAEQIRSLGLLDIEWHAVEADQSWPMTGIALSGAAAERLRRLALPGEAGPQAGFRVPNSRAATAAYAESYSDGMSEAMRVALFDALWVHGQNIADPNVIRSIVFGVLNPDLPTRDIEGRIRANQPIVPLGDPDPLVATRRLGFIVSMARGPLTLAGSRRLDAMRDLWHEHGEPELPLLVIDDGEIYFGEQALQWLGNRLPHPGCHADTDRIGTASAQPQHAILSR